MTSVTFETATIADAVRRAARIAPGKAGHAFDKASGLFFEINPAADAQCLLRATNLDAFHSEIIATVHSEGDPTRWRLPSALLDKVVGSLPPKSGSQVRFEQQGNRILIQQNRMKSTMQLIDDQSFPDWEMFDSSELTMVAGLGQRVSMVEWAASSDNAPPLCSVYLDGEYAVATDRYRVARVPCKIDNMPRPIMIPSGILGTSLKSMGDTGIGFTDHQLLLAPDDYTQLTTVVFEGTYPPIGMIFDFEYDAVVEVNKEDLLQKMNRAMGYAGAERNPVLRTFWGKGEIAIMMENAEVGLFGDVIECPGQMDHNRVEIKFTPKNLIDALNHAPDAKVKLFYDVAETDPAIKKTIRVDGGAGYQVWVMKRQEVRPTV